MAKLLISKCAVKNPNTLQYIENLKIQLAKNNIKIYPISPTLYDTLEDFDAYEALCLIASEKPMSYFDFHLKNLRDLEDEYFMHEEVFKNYDYFTNFTQPKNKF